MYQSLFLSLKTLDLFTSRLFTYGSQDLLLHNDELLLHSMGRVGWCGMLEMICKLIVKFMVNHLSGGFPLAHGPGVTWAGPSSPALPLVKFSPSWLRLCTDFRLRGVNFELHTYTRDQLLKNGAQLIRPSEIHLRLNYMYLVDNTLRAPPPLHMYLTHAYTSQVYKCAPIRLTLRYIRPHPVIIYQAIPTGLGPYFTS